MIEIATELGSWISPLTLVVAVLVGVGLLSGAAARAMLRFEELRFRIGGEAGADTRIDFKEA